MITLLALSSALSYVVLTVLVLRGRWRPAAGNRWLNIAGVAAFALSRFAPQNLPIDACASIILGVALVFILRRSSSAAAIFAALPLAAMLLTIDRAFFSAAVAQDFQNATIALLCAAGPLALIFWLISLSRQRQDFPTTFSR